MQVVLKNLILGEICRFLVIVVALLKATVKMREREPYLVRV